MKEIENGLILKGKVYEVKKKYVKENICRSCDLANRCNLDNVPYAYCCIFEDYTINFGTYFEEVKE